MILAIDAGNTMTKFGLFDKSRLTALHKTATKTEKTSDDWSFFILNALLANGKTSGDITGVIISSVVPQIDAYLGEACEKALNISPIFVSHRVKTGIVLDTDDPSEVGADRICAAQAAAHYHGKPVIVANFGTATCYDLVDERGHFCAAVTSPGLKTAAESLWGKAARLDKVELKAPESILARNTNDSLQAGVVYGCVGQTEYIINKLKEASGCGNAVVVGCGGYSDIIATHTDVIDIIDKDLIMKGLLLIYDENRA
ncbi:MAG: type III pantothenate kinase [Eubacteriaceae bacterium]|nr:type III pantothenate kinase [Eubacteriaceae bacterium]